MRVQSVSFNGFSAFNKAKNSTFAQVEKKLSKFDLSLTKMNGNWYVTEDLSKIALERFDYNSFEKTLTKAQYLSEGKMKDIEIPAKSSQEATEKLLKITGGKIRMKNIGTILLK